MHVRVYRKDDIFRQRRLNHSGVGGRKIAFRRVYPARAYTTIVVLVILSLWFWIICGGFRTIMLLVDVSLLHQDHVAHLLHDQGSVALIVLPGQDCALPLHWNS